jgi:hypothetical protein
MTLMRKTRLEGWYEYTRTPCIICGHTGGCMVHKDGEAVVCIRIESDRVFSKKFASYIHYLKGKKQKIDQSILEEFSDSNNMKNTSSQLNEVYQELLNILDLSDSHYDHLTSTTRQLTDQQVGIRQYRSFPEKPWETARMLQEDLGLVDFTGVPGFYLKNDSYWTIAGADGILLPFRSHYNQILGFQYRIDNPPNVVEVKINKEGLNARLKEQPNVVQIIKDGEIIEEKTIEVSKKWVNVTHGRELLGWVRVVKGNRYYWLSSANKPKGTGSGNPAPIHVSVPSAKLKTWEVGTIHKAKTVWLSEGPLKCDIASDCIEKLYDPLEIEDIGSTFLALPGVSSWRLALPILKEMEVEQVNICFDADAVSNPQVKKHLLDCAKELKNEGFKGNLIIWNESDGKGIDEVFLLRKLPHIKKLF